MLWLRRRRCPTGIEVTPPVAPSIAPLAPHHQHNTAAVLQRSQSTACAAPPRKAARAPGSGDGQGSPWSITGARGWKVYRTGWIKVVWEVARPHRKEAAPGLAGGWPSDGGHRQGFQVGERTGEYTGIKSSRWSCRSSQGGANPYHAGARGGRERPGKSGGVARPWRARGSRVWGRTRETRGVSARGLVGPGSWPDLGQGDRAGWAWSSWTSWAQPKWPLSPIFSFKSKYYRIK
jgi:hypothetical protein